MRKRRKFYALKVVDFDSSVTDMARKNGESQKVQMSLSTVLQSLRSNWLCMYVHKSSASVSQERKERKKQRSFECREGKER